MANEGRYVRFEPKYDNTNEVISADHINDLQDTSERTQQGIFKAQDRDFLDKALFILEHHRVVNGMWLDLFENTSKIDLPRSSHLVFSEVEQGIVFPDTSTSTEGYLYSRPYINANASNMKQVMVIVSGSIPANSHILVEISNNNADWFEVPLSNSELFEIPTEGSRLQLRAKLTRSDLTVSPRLDAWAIMYRDPKNEILTLPNGKDVIVKPPTPDDPGGIGDGDYPGLINIMHHQLMGIGPNDHHDQEHRHDGEDGSGLISHNVLTEVGPDDHHPKAHYHGEDGIPYVRLDQDVSGTLPLENLSYQMWTGKPGTTGLFYDPAIGDKLVYVKTPDDETYMFYDLVQDRLSHTISIVQGIAVWENLIFGEYINSSGESTTVLNGTEKQHYDASDPMILREIQKIIAPAAPSNLLVINPGTGTELELTWSPNTEFDIVGYNVYRSTNGGTTWVQMNTTGVIPTTTFVVDGLMNNADYLFAVTAIDATGYESAKSTSVAGRPTLTDTVAPGQVQNASIIRVSSGVVEISWDQNNEPDLDRYRVWMSPTGVAGSFAIAGEVAVGTHVFTQSSLLVGSTYYFYVTALDISGNQSVPSIVVSQTA